MRKQLALFLAIALIGAIVFLSIPFGGVTITTSGGHLSVSTNVALAVSTIEEPSSNPVSSPPMTWYDSNYTYRKSFNITNTTAGAQTNYTMRLLVSKNSGSDGAGTVNLSGYCQDDFDDIRFTNATDVKVDFWTETVNSGINATVWIEFDNINATGNTSFYIYYNNATATSASNGTNTFPFFDHFPGVAIDTDKWEIDLAQASVADSILTYAYASAAWKKINTINNYGVGYRLRTRAQFPTNLYAMLEMRDNDSTTYADIFTYTASPYMQLRLYVAGVNKGSPTTNIDMGSYAIYELYRTASAYSAFKNDVEMTGSPIAFGFTGDYPCQISVYNSSMLFDWVLFRKYVSPEPTWGSWGSEETLAGVPTVTNGVGATNVTTTSATLNGNLTDDVGENCTAIIYWGDNDGVTTAGNWDNNETIGTNLTNGTFYTDVSNLTNVTYYYRCYANNTAGSDWADSTVTFKQPAIANTPSSHDFGVVWENSTYPTGLTAFNVTNTGDVPVNISIQGTNMTGGTNITSSIRYEYYNTGADGTGHFYITYWCAQTFTPTISHKITSIKLELETSGHPIGIGTFGIRATNITTGKPTGNDLCNGTLDMDAIPGGSSAWYEISLGTGSDLTAGTKYAIVARTDNGSAGAYGEWDADISLATYNGGQIEESNNSGSTWTSYPTQDYMFEEWGPTLYRWTLNDTATPGADIYGLKAGTDYTVSTEEQNATNDCLTLFGGGPSREGQHLTISNRTVYSLSFYVYKYGDVTGNVTFTIRDSENDTILNSQVWGDASALNTTATLETVTFDTPVNINGEVRILVEFYGGSLGNSVIVNLQSTDVKEGEYFTIFSGTYTDHTNFDCTYQYTYQDYTITVKLNSPYNNLCTDLGVGNSTQWGLELYTPTSYSDGYEKSGVVTLTATEAS